MSYEPVNNTLDISKICENLFGYLEDTHETAIVWANGNQALPKFAKIYTSSKGRISTIFPCLMLLTKSHATDFSGDVLSVVLRFVFECQITGGIKDAIVEKSDIYAKAVESMLANIPPNILCANAMNVMVASLETLETEFDLVRANVGNTSFLQVFQTEVIYQLEGSIL